MRACACVLACMRQLGVNEEENKQTLLSSAITTVDYLVSFYLRTLSAAPPPPSTILQIPPNLTERARLPGLSTLGCDSELRGSGRGRDIAYGFHD